MEVLDHRQTVPKPSGASKRTQDRSDAVSMYKIPPIGDLALEDFYSFAFDRLKGSFSAGLLWCHVY